MTDAELTQQPITVREEFEKIADAEVDRDSVIVNLRSELRTAQANRKAVSEKHDRIRSILANIQNDIDRTNLEIAEINGLRPLRIAAALIEGGDFIDDDELLVRRPDLERFAKRIVATDWLRARDHVWRHQSQRHQPCRYMEYSPSVSSLSTGLWM